MFCIFQFDECDEFLYCGTDTGDIIGVNMKSKNFQEVGPKPKEMFSCGITCLTLLKNGQILVGAGDGTVCITEGKNKGFKRTS